MPLAPLSRRSLLIGGGAGIGLVVGYPLWPRAPSPLLTPARREHLLGGFVRIAEDGVVTVAIPQVELGHGVFTSCAQIVADELGADWSRVGVEVALPGAMAVNALLDAEWGAELGFAATGGSTSVRGFEAQLRDAGSAARALLCVAAAARWDVDPQALTTHDGFVWHGDERTAFGALCVEAARAKLPANTRRREGGEHRLTPASLPRIDVPAKVDGTAQFAGDVRLPGLAYASIASGPIGATRLVGVDKAAIKAMRGVLEVVESGQWVAAVGTNWWAANRALEAMRPRFATLAELPSDATIDAALTAAFKRDGQRVAQAGDVHAAFADAQVVTQQYAFHLAPHAAVETATATATIEDGVLRIWTNTQVPGLAARAAARATGFALGKVVVQPMLVGGSFGARYEVAIVEQAAVLAQRLARPVQLTRSRPEEMRRDTFRPPAQIRLAARVGREARIEAWFAQVATPDATEQAARNTGDRVDASEATTFPPPPYAIPNLAIDHHMADIGVPTGDWRGGARVATAFATESFVDELAARAGIDPFSYRMAMLGDNVRLARCLSRIVALGGWEGGASGSSQGIACHQMAGSYAAVLAEAYIADGLVKVARLVAVVDVGRVINPGIVRAQVIGGLVFGMSAATHADVTMRGGLAGPTPYGALGLPRIADCPEIVVELVQSSEAPGGAGEIAVPPVAPAIANALVAAAGVRYRALPLI